jgi:Tol biopolymer transport system component
LPHSGQGEPIQSLYRARSGTTSVDWQVTPVLNDIPGVPYISLAPDQTKFALTILEDRNSDGYVSFEGYNRGFDGPNVFSYSRKDDSMTRITSDYPIIFNPEWGADGQTILYGQSTYGLSSISVTDGQSHLITSFPEDRITWTDVSPDGRLIALNLDSIQINLVNSQTGEVTQITNETGGFGAERAWSPDSKWLTLNQPLTNYFSLLNTETMEVIPVADLNPIYPPTWSPDSRTLAIVQNSPQGADLFLLDPLLLSSEKLFSSSGQIYNLLWSPDSSELAIAIIEGSKTSLGVIDIESRNFREIWKSMDSTRVYMPAWSPDGQWLVFFDGKGTSLDHSEPAGIYVIHRSGGNVQKILETSGSSDPFGFFWLPITETP